MDMSRLDILSIGRMIIARRQAAPVGQIDQWRQSASIGFNGEGRSRTAPRPARGPGGSTPEGPYETRHLPSGIGISNPEMVQFLDFIEQLENETEAALDIRTGSREVRLLACLVRNHLNGKMTTSSSLAAASGMSYGTALRTIADCLSRGPHRQAAAHADRQVLLAASFAAAAQPLAGIRPADPLAVRHEFRLPTIRR